ncbi:MULTISPECIES: hypothetical protein [unclassified Nocardia]|uniref:hypothetical protein n=1 Tax=unclassified Nocardia TaxID=2637762 RepID=UPI0033A88DF5
MNWRSAASQRDQDDLDNLLHDSIGVAGEMLGGAAGFAPFMLVIGTDGERAMRRLGGAFSGEDSILDSLTFDDDRRDLRARATVYAVTVRQPFVGDAIKVAAEHAGGIAIDILVPYAMDDESVNIDMNGANATRGVRRLWS